MPATWTGIAELRRLRLMIVRDNATELASRAILGWQEEHGVPGTTSRPGEPMQNGLVESLIGRLRDECLNEHLFKSLPAARHVLELSGGSTTTPSDAARASTG